MAWLKVAENFERKLLKTEKKLRKCQRQLARVSEWALAGKEMSWCKSGCKRLWLSEDVNPTCVVCENDFCPKCIDKNHTGLCCTECDVPLCSSHRQKFGGMCEECFDEDQEARDNEQMRSKKRERSASK